jgi:hypothetical protein
MTHFGYGFSRQRFERVAGVADFFPGQIVSAVRTRWPSTPFQTPQILETDLLASIFASLTLSELPVRKNQTSVRRLTFEAS